MKRRVGTTLRAQPKCRGNRNWQCRYKESVPNAAERRSLESATAPVEPLPLLLLASAVAASRNASGAEMGLLLLLRSIILSKEIVYSYYT